MLLPGPKRIHRETSPSEHQHRTSLIPDLPAPATPDLRTRRRPGLDPDGGTLPRVPAALPRVPTVASSHVSRRQRPPSCPDDGDLPRVLTAAPSPDPKQQRPASDTDDALHWQPGGSSCLPFTKAKTREWGPTRE
uniref:Uncharacterized protein n=1 Tax=Zea mays TaxID=4577 RepID=A0A804R4C8_MAIZE